MSLDPIDKQILSLLQENAKMSIKTISKELNLSTTPIFERIKKLEKGKTIDKYVALLNAKQLGLKQTVFLDIKLKDHSRSYLERFLKEINQFPEVLECYHIAGEMDFMLKVVVEDITAYEQFILSRIAVIKNVDNVRSHICLSKNKSTTALVIR